MAIKPRGTKDIVSPEIEKWHYLEDKIKNVTRLFNYSEIRTPIFEHLEVFSRSIGETSDIVNKEMYVFSKGDGKKTGSYALRPEMTAALVRAAIENSIPEPHNIARLWYFGPFFRYERPQAGRQRQFHQFGAECLGSNSSIADLEIINLAINLTKSIGIENYKLIINTLGNRNSQEAYFKILQEYLRDNLNSLSDISKERTEKNPLRVLDSKETADQEIIKNAPRIKDSLDTESQDHISKVYEQLNNLNINYVVDDNLVRGLDYYSHTVFEFKSDELGSQDSFGGGGRYNELFSQLGGKDVPAIGFAMGVERLLMILEKLNKLESNIQVPDVYVVKADDDVDNFLESLLEKLRSNGLNSVRDLTSRSVKSQFKESSKLGAKWTIVIGKNELESGRLSIKNMKSSEQFEVEMSELEKFNFKYEN